MKKITLLLLLCAVYLSYGQRLATGSPERVVIVQGQVLSVEQMGQIRLTELGGTPRIMGSVSEEKRDSLIEIFGDILPPKELIMYIDVVPFTEEQQAARREAAPGEPVVVRRESVGGPVVVRHESGEPTTTPVVVRQMGVVDQASAGRPSLFPFEVGEKVPDFTLNDVNGNPFTLSSLRGKYVVLSFWGTWCAPCIANIPDMIELYETYRDFAHFVGVAARERSVEVWRQTVVERFEKPWINVLDETGETIAKYGIRAWPTQIFVDPEGRFVTFALGASMLSRVLENAFGGRE